MLARSLLNALLLMAMLATAFPDAAWSGKSERRPIDQPAKESEEKEKEESAGKSELEGGDDFETFPAGAFHLGWSTRTSALNDLEFKGTRHLLQRGPDHCRAPPALLL